MPLEFEVSGLQKAHVCPLELSVSRCADVVEVRPALGSVTLAGAQRLDLDGF